MVTQIVLALMIIVLLGSAYYIGKIVATMQLLTALAEHHLKGKKDNEGTK